MILVSSCDETTNDDSTFSCRPERDLNCSPRTKRKHVPTDPESERARLSFRLSGDVIAEEAQNRLRREVHTSTVGVSSTPPPSSVLCLPTRRDPFVVVIAISVVALLLHNLAIGSRTLSFPLLLLATRTRHNASQEQKEGRGRGSRRHARRPIRSRQE
jgi:hypothetical protein